MREHRLLWECGGAKGTPRFPMKATMGPNPRTMIVTLISYTAVTVLVMILTYLTLNRTTRAFLVTIGLLLWLVTVCMHLASSWSDPGFNAYVENDGTKGGYTPEHRHSLRSTDSSRHICGRCYMQKEHGTHHCHRCNRCVRKHDHHCPFTSTW